MSWLYRSFVRPILFAQDSEAIHERTLAALAWISRRPWWTEAMAEFFAAPELTVELFGLKFPNPLGLAAGMDKAAVAVPAWAALGFGFSELGGVTWHPQPGNPAPRLFRALADEALINRMGFNNPGAEAFAETLAGWRSAGRWPNHPVGINLGKSKITPLEKAAEDYAQSLRILWPLADFFVVNVSSPNTPNLRQLQDQAALDTILAAMQEVNQSCADEVQSSKFKVQGSSAEPESRAGSQAPAGQGHAPHIPHPASRIPRHITKPILVKVAPDLSFEALDDILELAGPRQIAGIIATNTTIQRPATRDPVLLRAYAETGGLSGRPLRARSTEVIRHLHRQSRGTLPIIGVGGIFDAEDAWEKITAGASLAQIYTGLVYQGPGVVRAIVRGLRERLAEAGLAALSQAVGLSARDA